MCPLVYLSLTPFTFEGVKPNHFDLDKESYSSSSLIIAATRFMHPTLYVKVCGGGHNSSGWHTCVTLTRGSWHVSHNISHSQRWGHSSWATEQGTYLMGGGVYANMSLLITPAGTVENAFALKNYSKYTSIFKTQL